MDGILAHIVERTLEDVSARVDKVSRRTLEEAGRARARERHSLEAALRRRLSTDPIRFLCEIKKESPSKGVLAPDIQPAAQAKIYAAHGAAAVSVVTEPHFFAGEDGFLEAAREGAPGLPLLRKDFHVHELQLFEAAAGEADAVLLLAAVLSATQLKDYLDIADAFSLGHLVEVNNPKEAEVALRAGARVIGVNNRDLGTFQVDLTRTERVLPVFAQTGIVSVAESGIADREVVERMERAGVHALLVGEALVTAVSPGDKLDELRGIAGP